MPKLKPRHCNDHFLFIIIVVQPTVQVCTTKHIPVCTIFECILTSFSSFRFCVSFVDVFIMCGESNFFSLSVITRFKLHLFFLITLILSHEQHSTSWTHFWITPVTPPIYSLSSVAFIRFSKRKGKPTSFTLEQLHSDCLHL